MQNRLCLTEAKQIFFGEVKIMGGEGSGRRTSILVEANTQKMIDDAAPHAAKLLSEHVRGTRKRLSSSLQRACEYVIDHAIGKSRQKVEHSGGILTYRQLADGAEELDKKPRPILADAMEIAHKYQEKMAEKDTENKE